MYFFNIFDVTKKQSLGDSPDLKSLLISVKDQGHYNDQKMQEWIDQVYDTWSQIVGDITSSDNVVHESEVSFGDTTLRITPYVLEGNVDQMYEQVQGIYHIIPINELGIYPFIEFGGGVHADDLINWAASWNDNHPKEPVDPMNLAQSVKRLRDERTHDSNKDLDPRCYTIDAQIGDIPVVIDLVTQFVPTPKLAHSK